MNGMIVPKGWEVKTVAQACDILDNQRIPLNDEERQTMKGHIPYYGANAIVDYIDSYLFDEDLILLAEDGGNFDDYENRQIAYKITGKSWVNNHAHIVRPKKKFDFNFIFYSLQHKNITSFIRGGTRSKLNQSDLKAVELLTPISIFEQQKIATILLTLDRTIEAAQKLIDKEKMVKKGLMADLLTHGIDEQGWGEKRLIDVVDKSDRYSFTGGPFGSDLKSSDYVEQGVRVLQLQNIGDGKFKNNDFVYTSEEKAEELKSCQIFPDEIIMSKMGDPVGRACLIPNIEPKYVMCSDGIRIAVNRKEYDNKFIYYTINHDTFRKSIERVALGSTRKRVGLTELKVLTFYVPALLEQQKIAQILSAQDRKIETEETNLAKLQNLKKGLMGDLLSGKVRVK